MLDPEAYYNIANAMNCKKEEREEAIKQVIKRIDDALKPTIQGYEIKGRSKHFYSIYRKMKYQNKQLDEIFDLTAVRVIVGSVKDCYAVLGMVHTMWKPVPKRFKVIVSLYFIFSRILSTSSPSFAVRVYLIFFPPLCFISPILIHSFSSGLLTVLFSPTAHLYTS